MPEIGQATYRRPQIVNNGSKLPASTACGFFLSEAFAAANQTSEGKIWGKKEKLHCGKPCSGYSAF